MCPVIVVSHFLIVFGSVRFLINFFPSLLFYFFFFLSFSKPIYYLLWASVFSLSTSYEGISIIFCSIFGTKFSAGKKFSPFPYHSRYCHCHLPLYFTDAERTGKPFKSASSFFRFFRRQRSKILINAGWEREKKIDILHVLPRDQNWKRSIAHPAIVFEKKEEKKRLLI